MQREFLMLAHKFDPKKFRIGGWLASEKLDGMRCFWDGGVSRGKSKESIPWANTDKDERLREEQICTGLWSRYGNVIHAPDWWLDELPPIPLDGELHNFKLSRQLLMSIIKKFDSDPQDWTNVDFYVFDSPKLLKVFEDGVINNTNFKKVFNNIKKWLAEHSPDVLSYEPNQHFPSLIYRLKNDLAGNRIAIVHNQIMLPYNYDRALYEMRTFLDKICDKGGEGLIIRNPYCVWHPKRTNGLLKVKPLHDAEGIVIGFTHGKGKLEGKMGALILKWGAKEFQLSGFTDEERRLDESGHPIYFPEGSKVTFRYRALTDDGIPQEARYWRKA